LLPRYTKRLISHGSGTDGTLESVHKAGLPATGGYMAAIHVLSMRDENLKHYPPEHWRKRAQEARELAWAAKDADAREEMETIAQLYEKLAEFAKLRLKKP
jgi:hypothetical protein